MATAQDKLRLVPQPIQDWFWSETVDQAILDIEAKFSLPETETALPRLLFAVEVKEITLTELEAALASKLGITPALARSVYEEIKLKILIPIANDLVRFGIGEEELAPATKKTVPVPIGPQLDMRGLAIGSVPAPASPATIAPPPVVISAPAFVSTSAPAAVPTPISLHRDDLANQQRVSAATATIGGPIGSGNLAPSITPSRPTMRAAHIDLGTAAKLDSKFESIFVEKKTPAPEIVDYAAAQAAPQAFPVTAPVPLSMSGAPAAPVVPQPEVVAVPLEPEADPAPSGFVDSIISRIAPWHSAKFRKGSKHATEALEDPIPTNAKSIDYSDAPAPSAPTSTGTPTPIDDLPAPPKA